jgi:hypothetical protein
MHEEISGTRRVQGGLNHYSNASPGRANDGLESTGIRTGYRF